MMISKIGVGEEGRPYYEKALVALSPGGVCSGFRGRPQWSAFSHETDFGTYRLREEYGRSVGMSQQPVVLILEQIQKDRSVTLSHLTLGCSAEAEGDEAREAHLHLLADVYLLIAEYEQQNEKPRGAARLFCFGEDDGSRESLSVVYERILTISDGPDMGLALNRRIEELLEEARERREDWYDPPINGIADEDWMLQALRDEGYTCDFLSITLY